MELNLDEEIEHFKSKNVECKLIKSNKFKIIEVKVTESLLLRVILQDDYPFSWPVSVKIHTFDTKNLKESRQQAIQEFIKQTNLDLNLIVDSNQGKCVLIQLYEKALSIFSSNEPIKESLQVLESRCKNKVFKIDSQFQNEQKSVLISEPEPDHNDKKEDSNDSKGKKFKGSDFIFQRIKWDNNIDKSQIIIGYLDRFTGVKEIKFNDFKGVHDDRDGVPLHRIRYFKINDKIVWDRDKKLDLITGVGDISAFFEHKSQSSVSQSEQNRPNLSKETKLIESPVYEYKMNNWVESENESENKPDFLNTFKLLTYNLMSQSNFKRSILSRVSLNTNCGLEGLDQIDRVPHFVSLLETNSPDFVLLQECDSHEEDGLKASNFVRKNYFICSLPRDGKAYQQHSHCVLLSKIKPTFFKSLLLSEKSNKSAQICKFNIRTKSFRKYEQILIVNIHLSSNKVSNAVQKRETQLRELADSDLDADYVFICGDFNFGDSGDENRIIEELFLKNGYVDLVPNCFTFDPSTNFSSTITSAHSEPRRLDRVLLKTKNKNLFFLKSYLVNTLPFKIQVNNPILLDDYLRVDSYPNKNFYESGEELSKNPTDGFYLHPSDHYGLECHFKFDNNLHETSLTYKSALAVLIPKSLSEDLVQPIRELYDPQINRWPPHMNILYPFYENIEIDLSQDEEASVIGDIFKCLSKHEVIECEIKDFEIFDKNNVVHLKPCNRSTKALNLVYSDLKSLFEDKNGAKWSRKELTPHLTVAQPVDKKTAPKGWAKNILEEIKNNFKRIPNLKFDIDCLCWITRTESTPFQIRQVFPLGQRYPSITKGLSFSGQLFDFLMQKNTIIDKEQEFLFEKTVSVIKEKILVYAKNLFEESKLVTFGSYQHGVKTNDLDLCIVKPKSSYEQNFVHHLKLQMSQDPFFHIIRPIDDALVPIVELGFKDNNLSGADIQVHEIDADLKELFFDNYKFMSNLDVAYNKLYPISGIFENQNLKKYVQSYKEFQIILSFVKYWAKCRGIYGKAFGFLGGISWALIIVVYLRRNRVVDQSLESLIVDFFKFCSEWNWKEPMTVFSLDYVNDLIEKNEQKSAMMILQTVYPYHNTSKIVNERNKKLIVNELIRCYKILSKSLDYETACDKALDSPSKKICFKIKFNDLNDQNHLFTLLKAKVLGMVTNLEKKINANLRPMIEFNDGPSPNNFKHSKLYFIYIYGLTSDFNESEKNFINENCNGLISTIKLLSHANDFDILFNLE